MGWGRRALCPSAVQDAASSSCLPARRCTRTRTHTRTPARLCHAIPYTGTPLASHTSTPVPTLPHTRPAQWTTPLHTSMCAHTHTRAHRQTQGRGLACQGPRRPLGARQPVSPSPSRAHPGSGPGPCTLPSDAGSSFLGGCSPYGCPARATGGWGRAAPGGGGGGVVRAAQGLPPPGGRGGCILAVTCRAFWRLGGAVSRAGLRHRLLGKHRGQELEPETGAHSALQGPPRPPGHHPTHLDPFRARVQGVAPGAAAPSHAAHTAAAVPACRHRRLTPCRSAAARLPGPPPT